MPIRFEETQDVPLDQATLRLLLHEHVTSTRPRLHRLWTYFRNPLEPVGTASAGPRWYRLAQEVGLPPRFMSRSSHSPEHETVIENDIAWRLHAMIDFMLAKPVRILSDARDPTIARHIEDTLERVWESSGGIALLQDIALLGHVYGYVDLVVRIDDDALQRPGADAADAIRIEPVDATRAIPVLAPDDYRKLDAYITHVEQERTTTHEPIERPDRRTRLFNRPSRKAASRARVTITEVFSRGVRRLYQDDRLVDETHGALLHDELPVVHIQNLSQPFHYAGLSEVEALIPMQDELNTRLSDRAHRVTMQSFQMFLAKGIEGFERAPIGPGLLWNTDNPEASIESFGADAEAPSETAHVQEIREALDKISAVPPLAGGVVRARIGNLSSANALRITLMGILAKTARKRITYGRGIQEASRLVLLALHRAGALDAPPEDHALRLVWPDPLPADDRELTRHARTKVELGVPVDDVLAELGHPTHDQGIT